jgi:polyisoprenoid-binding protein YceI
MHGVSKKVVLPFTIVKRDGNTIGFKCLTTINRLDYGVASDFKHTTMPGFLSEEIEVQIVFWTKKRKEE